MVANVRYGRKFLKHFEKRIAQDLTRSKKFEERLQLFVSNPADPAVRDHALTGKLKGFRSFAVTGDIRVIYKVMKDGVLLYDIGTHSQVY